MAATIKIKNSSTASAIPTSSDLVQGELAVNVTDKRLFTENASGTVVELGTNPSSITLPDGSASAPTLLHSGDTNTGLFFPAADTIALTTGGTERLRLDSSGSLGLGVTPSAWGGGKKVLQASNASFAGQSDRFEIWANAYYDGSAVKYISNGYATLYQSVNGAHSWQTAASGTAGGTVTLTQAMTLDASGNLGIGATSPANYTNYKTLTIQAPSGGTGAEIDLKNPSGTTVGAMYSTATDFVIASDFTNAIANSILRFDVDGSERARIDSSGNLLVGTTSTVSNARFVVVGSVADDCARIINQNASPYGLIINYSGATPNNSSNQFIDGYDNNYGNLRFKMQSNGGLGNYQANNTNLSDRREKTNFAPAGDYLAKICAIPVQTFNYIDQNLEEDDGLTLGVVAQDVQAVAPELVTETNWAGKDAEPKMRLSIYQTDLQYALMKSIQELKAIVDAQAAEIAALKG